MRLYKKIYITYNIQSHYLMNQNKLRHGVYYVYHSCVYHKVGYYLHDMPTKKYYVSKINKYYL